MELIKGSKEIYDRAVADFKPQAIVMMLSGGDDSTTAYAVARELGIKFDAVIHGNTRTGIPETSEFAAKQVEQAGDRLGISRFSMIDKEKGRSGGFTGGEIAVMAMMYGQSPDYFFGGTFNPDAIMDEPPSDF